ncbi:MAG: 30S ribosomal protein S1 [Spirulinaceae cyanobacterium SM2_1_0]|nr:30S ribosomal protein S1 [Spirulinaceae cyanobacterium SM2_1_0]
MNSDSTARGAKASFSADDFARALEQEQYDYTFQRGGTVRGTPIEYGQKGVYVEIGGKSPGFVPASEVSVAPTSDFASVLPIGEECEFAIIRDQDAEGQIVLSRRQFAIQQAWQQVKDWQAEGTVVPVRVTGINRGGITGTVEGLRAFIPRSHLLQKDDLEALVGQSLAATFLEVDPERRRLVLSQREAARAQALQAIATGDLASGTVASIQPYGVFVDINGVTGLLHIKQISQKSVPDLKAVFKIGQPIKVVVLDVDESRNRISLTTKSLESYPGELLEKWDLVMANAEMRLEAANQPAVTAGAAPEAAATLAETTAAAPAVESPAVESPVKPPVAPTPPAPTPTSEAASAVEPVSVAESSVAEPNGMATKILLDE